MKKILTTMILGIFLLSFISAGISIELESLGEIYAGEEIQRELTITTTEDMLVYISYNSSKDIQLNYTSPIQINKYKIIQINISTNKYMDSSEQTIIIYANAEGEEQTQTPPSRSNGGSSSSSSKTIYIVDNVSGKDYGDASKYPTYNDKETSKGEPTIQYDEPIGPEQSTEEDKPYWKLWLFGGILILVMFILFKFSRKKSYSLEHGLHEQEEHTNEKEDHIK